MSWHEVVLTTKRILLRRFTSRRRELQWRRLQSGGVEFVFIRRELPMVVSVRDDAISRKLYIAGEHEFQKFKQVLKLLRVDQLQYLFDIGANIGEICIRAVKEGLATRGVAVEADLQNFQLLTVNAGLNGLTGTHRLELHHAAAGTGTPNFVQLKKSSDNFGDHQVLPSQLQVDQPECNADQVRNLRLDSLNLSKADTSSLLWVDVQGYETQVLTGASSLLQSLVPIALEVSPLHLERYSSFGEFVSLVSKYRGYFDLHLHNPSLQPLKNLEARYLQLREVSRHTDILLI